MTSPFSGPLVQIALQAGILYLLQLHANGPPVNHTSPGSEILLSPARVLVVTYLKVPVDTIRGFSGRQESRPSW